MQTNQQIPVKRVEHSGNTLLVHSVFRTIQGEGPFAGRPCVFIRLGGCNLQCPGCDTEYTQGAELMTVGEVIDLARQHGACDMGLVIVTGGEPFRQNIAMLCNTFIALDIEVQIETNGTLSPSQGLHSSVAIVCSPKTGKVNRRIAQLASAWKYVARADDLMPDGLPVAALGHTAVPHLARPFGQAPVYLQPMDEQDPIKNKANMDAVVKSCIKNGYRLCIQMHKIVGVE